MVSRDAVLITGGAKRIGRELAIKMAGRGFDVAISYNNSGREAKNLAEEIIREFGVRSEAFCVDLVDKNQVKRLFCEVNKAFPGWNLLINNASIFDESRFLDGEEDELMINFNIHLFSPLILAQEFSKMAIKNNIKDVQIINMVDKNIVRCGTKYFYYLLSKKSLADATKMLAKELAPSIRVNGIAPGFILNSINEANPGEETKKSLSKIPLAIKGELDNIWQAVEFLLNNKYVTGQILFIDGGASLW